MFIYFFHSPAAAAEQEFVPLIFISNKQTGWSAVPRRVHANVAPFINKIKGEVEFGGGRGGAQKRAAMNVKVVLLVLIFMSLIQRGFRLTRKKKKKKPRWWKVENEKIIKQKATQSLVFRRSSLVCLL